VRVRVRACVVFVHTTPNRQQIGFEIRLDAGLIDHVVSTEYSNMQVFWDKTRESGLSSSGGHCVVFSFAFSPLLLSRCGESTTSITVKMNKLHY
jgi:hypothetical protein